MEGEEVKSQANGVGNPPGADGIFVYAEDMGEGRRKIAFALQGNVDPLAVPAMLHLAAAAAERNLGFARG